MRQAEQALPGFGYKDRKPKKSARGGNPDNALVCKDPVVDGQPERQESPDLWLRRLSVLSPPGLHAAVDRQRPVPDLLDG